jgi:hypothetical protein
MFFEEMAVASPSSVQHLISYEMITATPPYEFRIPMIGNILRGIESSPMTARKEEKTVKGRLEVWADIGRLRNRIEPKLRVALKRILKAHLGDRWISPVLLAVPEQKRKQLEGVDANEILENRLLLTELMVVVHNNWTYFRSFETAIKTQRLTKEKMSVLLDFLNAHREDAHASQVNDIDKVAVGVVAETLDRVLDAFLKD